MEPREQAAELPGPNPRREDPGLCCRGLCWDPGLAAARCSVETSIVASPCGSSPAQGSPETYFPSSQLFKGSVSCDVTPLGGVLGTHRSPWSIHPGVLGLAGPSRPVVQVWMKQSSSLWGPQLVVLQTRRQAVTQRSRALCPELAPLLRSVRSVSMLFPVV